MEATGNNIGSQLLTLSSPLCPGCVLPPPPKKSNGKTVQNSTADGAATLNNSVKRNAIVAATTRHSYLSSHISRASNNQTKQCGNVFMSDARQNIFSRHRPGIREGKLRNSLLIPVWRLRLHLSIETATQLVKSAAMNESARFRFSIHNFTTHWEALDRCTNEN